MIYTHDRSTVAILDWLPRSAPAGPPSSPRSRTELAGPRAPGWARWREPD